MRLLRHTLRVAARSFVRHPGFTAVAILSLALAISLNTTMYGVLDAMIAPKLDMRDPGDLYRLAIWGDYKGQVDAPTRAQLLRGAMHNFEAVSYYSGNRSELAIEYGGRFALSRTAVAAPNYFSMLGVQPAAGRYFGAADLTASTFPVVISERLAATLFVGDGGAALRRCGRRRAGAGTTGHADRSGRITAQRINA